MHHELNVFQLAQFPTKTINLRFVILIEFGIKVNKANWNWYLLQQNNNVFVLLSQPNKEQTK